jgi:hypothetical protein
LSAGAVRSAGIGAETRRVPLPTRPATVDFTLDNLLHQECRPAIAPGSNFNPRNEGSASALASRDVHRHVFGMFVITEADAAAIRAVFNQEGELSAAIELRRRFPGVTDNAKARA